MLDAVSGKTGFGVWLGILSFGAVSVSPRAMPNGRSEAFSGEAAVTLNATSEGAGGPRHLSVGRAWKRKRHPERSAGRLRGHEDAGSSEVKVDVSSFVDHTRPGLPRSPGCDEVGVWLVPSMAYNRVEAARIGISAGLALRKRYCVVTETGWSSGRKVLDAALSASLPMGGDDRLRFLLNAATRTTPRIESRHHGRALTSMAVLLGFADYFDYFHLRGFSAGIAWSSGKGSGLGGSLLLRTEEHRSLRRVTSFDLIGRVERQRYNPEIDEGRYRGATISLSAGEPHEAWGPVRRIEISAEVALDALDEAFTFARAEIVADLSMPTFFRRQALPNRLDIRLVVSGHAGDLPVQYMGMIDGRVLGYQPFGVFRTLRGRPYEGERLVSLFWQHDFRSVPFEYIGLRGLASKGTGLVVHGGHGSSYVSRSTLRRIDYSVRTTGPAHHELGLSVTNLLGAPLRIDVTRRLDRRVTTLGFGVSHNW